LHTIECSTTRTYPWPDACLGSFSSRKRFLPMCAAFVHVRDHFWVLLKISDVDGDSHSFPL
jgi:hypothetical protein